MKNKIFIGSILAVVLLTLCVINIKPSLAFNDNLIDETYTYNIAPSKIYLASKDITPLTDVKVRQLYFNYVIDVVSEPTTINGITYPINSIILIITGYHCELEASYIYNNTMYSETLYYSWNRESIDGFFDTQRLVDTNRIYIPLDYNIVKSGNYDLNNNVMAFSPEIYFNVYRISNTNDLNGVIRYGLGTYLSIDLYASNNTFQQVRLANDTNYLTNDTRFFNTERINTLPSINYDTTFKDINYIYIDTLVKNATIRQYLKDNPADNSLKDVDFSDWITTAVGGFLNFEIVPGLSLSNILLFILSIGLVFLFLRFFSGG